MNVGVGILGCGQWGANHVRVWSAAGALRAVFDVEPSRAQEAAARAGVLATSSVEELLGRRDIKGVVIATPAATHAELGLRALEAGKDVLIEKPLALTVGDGRKLVELAEAQGSVLMVDHLLNFHPAVQRLRALVERGVLGRVRYLYSHRLNFGRLRTEENALWSFAPHDLALLHSILGDAPSTVACHGGAYVNQAVADVTLMSLTFTSDVRAHVFVSWLHPFKEHRFIVVGDKEMAVFDDTAPWPEKLVRYPHQIDWVDGRIPVAQRAAGIAEPLDEQEPLQLACEHFLRCMETRRQPSTGPASGIAVLEMLDAGDRSLASGGVPVTLHQATSGEAVHPTATVDPGAELGLRTRVWHYSHVMSGARIGRDCVLGQNVFVGAGVQIGDGVKIQNGVSVYEGVELEDDVFCGPSMVFTNVLNPRSLIDRKHEFKPTLVRRGATIGANATIVCGNTIGRNAFVAAGAVVTHDVPGHALIVGSPGRRVGGVCECGEQLSGPELECDVCGRRYEDSASGLVETV
ncbi:MAG: Gfo/Idh/MocA family oxidoreductase [Acidimicrobiia bacterium]|nr:Gfo/Idh/MocA family oxidoreductase [Acidimicrobiia bacterium]